MKEILKDKKELGKGEIGVNKFSYDCAGESSDFEMADNCRIKLQC